LCPHRQLAQVARRSTSSIQRHDPTQKGNGHATAAAEAGAGARAAAEGRAEAQTTKKKQEQQQQQPSPPHQEEPPAELLFGAGTVLVDREGKAVKDPTEALRGRAVGLLFGGMWWCVWLALLSLLLLVPLV